MGKRFAGLIAAVFWALSAAVAGADCAPDRLTVTGPWGSAAFSVSVADTPAARARGLMHVEQMPAMAGMLFVFDAPQHASFWMRNTLIPLDMIFAGPDGQVRKVHPNAIPLDETIIDGGDGVAFVFEINGGLGAQLGIMPGDQLIHPAIEKMASVACK